MNNKTVFFSVGEPSGDLHAGNLIKDLQELNRNRPQSLKFVGFGGPRMAEAGCRLLEDMTSLAVMFLNGIFSKIHRFRQLLRQAERVFASNSIDLVVLIDYSGFNWHVARLAKKHGIPVVFYGIPQMWAWAPWRIRKMQRNVDLGICKLPFEKKWLNQRYCEAEYVGHPFFDEMQRQVIDQEYIAERKPVGNSSDAADPDLVTILPGSRAQEIRNCLPAFLKVAEQIQKNRPETRFAVSCLNEEHRSMAQSIYDQSGIQIDVILESNRTPELIRLARTCLACSGSVSLELMYREKPTVIYYKVGRIAYALQKVFLKIRYITLVNLLWSQSIERSGMSVYDPDSPTAAEVPFPEYLSASDKTFPMANQVLRLLNDEPYYSRKLEMLRSVKQEFGMPGASVRAARILCERFLFPESSQQFRAA